MNRNRTILTALTAAIALAPVGTALAATDAPSVKIQKAYGYIEKDLGDHKTYASIVFRTADALPRRYDGMIRASGFVDDSGHSLQTVRGAHGKARHCYLVQVQIKDGRVVGRQGRKATPGTKHALQITTADGAKDQLSVTLHTRKPGDRQGKPIGC